MPRIDYKANDWRRKVWLSETRFYSAELRQDLFGDWMLECQWSGKHQKGGRIKRDYVNSYEEGLARFEEIEKRRLKRGYQEVQASW